jgi:hypothetical protein
MPLTLKQTEKIVNEYMQGVVLGKITACKYVKLAVKRHMDDLKSGHKRGLKFNPDRAFRPISFLGMLKQSKGKWAGQHCLGTVQIFKLGFFGWEKERGTPFRTSYNEEAQRTQIDPPWPGLAYMLWVRW